VLYTVRQNSSTPDTYCSCSDVVFTDGGTGRRTEAGGRGGTGSAGGTGTGTPSGTGGASRAAGASGAWGLAPAGGAAAVLVLTGGAALVLRLRRC
jgi:chitin-binding protein